MVTDLDPAVGLTSGWVETWQMSYSSSSAGSPAGSGRIDGIAWSPLSPTDVTTSYIQVDLLMPYIITGMEIQGGGSVGSVSQVALSTSMDCVAWTTVTENATEKVIHAYLRFLKT